MGGAIANDESALTGGIIGRRILAAIMDGVILALIAGVLHAMLWVLGFLTLGLGWYLAGGLWVIPIIYTVVFAVSPAQATPGQAYLGLCIADLGNLRAPTPAQILVYAVGYQITLSLGGVLLLIALFTRQARCLHDIVAGVVVVHREALTAPPAAWNMAGGYGRT